VPQPLLRPWRPFQPSKQQKTGGCCIDANVQIADPTANGRHGQPSGGAGAKPVRGSLASRPLILPPLSLFCCWCCGKGPKAAPPSPTTTTPPPNSLGGGQEGQFSSLLADGGLLLQHSLTSTARPRQVCSCHPSMRHHDSRPLSAAVRAAARALLRVMPYALIVPSMPLAVL